MNSRVFSSLPKGFGVPTSGQPTFAPQLLANAFRNQQENESEQEANEISDRVSRPTFSSVKPSRGFVGRGGGSETIAAPEVRQVLHSAGQPLDATTRAFMEPRFQFDFGRVRVHHDAAAARAASSLSARAFAFGRQIAFGRGQYSPGTAEGRKLLAHELTHVAQDAQSASPVLRRAPLLKGKSQQQFGESDAGTIDKAIAASPITKWVPAKSLIKLAGNVDTEDPVVFEQQFKDFGKSNESVDEVPGFVDRSKKKPVKLRLPGKNSAGQLVSAAKFEAAVHETIHLNSNAIFRGTFGHSYNEGVTQHFTELVLGESGKAYRDRVKLADELIAGLGEDAVGKAYFHGDKAPYARVVKGLGQAGKTNFSDWFKAKEKEPPDWQTANALLKSALTATSQPTTPAPAPSTSASAPSKTTE